MDSEPQRNILVCPLDWGMGHATRIQVVAKAFIDRNHKVYVAATEQLLDTFDDDIQLSGKIIFRQIKIRYSSLIPQYLAIFFQLPFLYIQMLLDNYRIRKIAQEYNIDILISDNRFGAWVKNKYSVYISHQLSIRLPRALKPARILAELFHRYIAEKYDECWIPDLPGDINLSAGLSHNIKLPVNSRYTGILSRMVYTSSKKPESLPVGKYITALLSGPEPQRSKLENIIARLFLGKSEELVIVAGLPGDGKPAVRNSNITRYDYLGSSNVRYLIQNSSMIICRSGYSTIMDLASLNRSALLVPTPGQPEQEYLAKYLSGRGWFATVSQQDLQSDLSAGRCDLAYSAIKDLSIKLLESSIDDVLKKSSLQGKMM